MDNAEAHRETVPQQKAADSFDRIMERVGNEGRFQLRYNITFNMGMAIFGSLIYYNIIMAMNAPDHWCHVPGRELTNLTVDQWRALTLPSVLDNHHEIRYSQCRMYTTNSTASNKSNFILHQDDEQSTTTVCVHGYEYNHTWFRNTIVTEHDWVCDKELYMYNTFVFDRVGEIFGSFVFGQLGDQYGRRIVLRLSLFAMLTGRIIQIYSASTYWVFAAAAVWGSVLANSGFQSVYIIAMEISKPDNRANVAIVHSISKSIGMCIMPLVFWTVGDWRTFMWATSVPIAAFYCFPKYMIESPRWLALKGKWERSAECLNWIASVNGNKANLTGDSLRDDLPEQLHETNYGMASLFTAARLARTTVLLVVCWICGSVGYFILILLIAQLPGNPFLNFFCQSFVELPSLFIGGYLCNYFGRRVTNIGVFVLSAVLCVVATFVVLHSEWAAFATGLSIVIKFCAGVTVFSVFLQMSETYPTCLRQTGISLGMVMSNTIGVFGPYVVLSEKIDSRYPFFILAIMFLIGGVSASFLHETLHQKLPDSIREATVFGRDQAFWSLPRKPKSPSQTKDSELQSLEGGAS